MNISPAKTIIFSFFLGGLFALVAQAILAFWNLTLTGTPMEFFRGGATLVSLGIIGCILGGTGVYQILQKWATFGALMPFSGFAMAVGMKAVGPWTMANEKSAKCVWNVVWFVVWFNVLFAAICIVLGYACAAIGIGEPAFTIEAVTGPILFFNAFLVGGILAVIFQCCFLIGQKIFGHKCEPLHILILAWMVGAILVPTGISHALMAWSGEGFGAMITVGGYNMFNVGVDFFHGHIDVALLHLGSFALAVTGLAVTALATWLIYNAKYGRKPIKEVHRSMAQHMLDDLA